MFDVLVRELSERYGLGDRSRDLFGLLVGYIYNDRRGGFAGFAESFRQQGHGDLFASWLGGDTGRPRTLTASDVGMVFGQGLLSDWGNRIGASRATVAAAIAGVLPRLIGELTPGGRVPEAFGAVVGRTADARIDDGDADDAYRNGAASAAHSDERIDAANLRRHARDTAGINDNGPLRFEDQLRRDDGRIEPTVAPAPPEQDVAAIAAALFSDDPLRDADYRRPPPRRSGSGWLLWLLVLLAAAAGAAYYWRDYLPLDGLQLPVSTQPATT